MPRSSHQHSDRRTAEPELNGLLGDEGIFLEQHRVGPMAVHRGRPHAAHVSRRTTSPALTFGSNHVDLGGIDRP